MRTPRFSIIIPNYNHGQFLEKAILSVIEQDYESKELIVIDGGSTDNSVETIKKYADKVAYWITEKDKGTYDANNKGLAKITGDFWCILNSDDILLPGSLTSLAGIIGDHPDKKWIAGAQSIIDENDVVIDQLLPHAPKPLAGYTFLEACWIPHASTFLHKDIPSQVGLFEKWHLMDYNYWLRMEQQGYVPFITALKISAMRIHAGSKSYDHVSLYREVLKVIVSFCESLGILDRPEIKSKINYYRSLIYKLIITRYLVHKDKGGAFVKLVALFFMHPSTITRRWFWGLLLRICFGLRENDPILLIPKKSGTASWEYS
jgi:glycosyltransferase involved in cell wall biosynthesis